MKFYVEVVEYSDPEKIVKRMGQCLRIRQKRLMSE